jgi:hypothetical protein
MLSGRSLHLNGATRRMGRLSQQPLGPSEGEGYAPVVIPSCGPAANRGAFVVPAAVSDYAGSSATVPRANVLAAMTRTGD